VIVASDTTGVAGVIVAVLALLVAGAAVWYARRSARAAEKSAAEAERSASAAERTAEAEEGTLELGRRSETRERVRDAEERAPKWEAIADGEEGCFRSRDGVLEGRLRNAGLLGAKIELAVLDLPSGGRLPLTCRREPVAPGWAGWESRPHIPPGGVLALRAEVDPSELVSHARPSIYIDVAVGGQPHLNLVGATVELLASGTAADGSQLWRGGRVRPGLLA
jgi:hypothetical protein